ncbi:SRPBCC family protein [Conyzicola sp.]|uniref:SRPBCC family protein n=1 Tax=Conyzicola sp. TaxID=1969404 RepID=UPI003989D41F
MTREPVYVEVLIRADLDTVWRLTQEPAEHTRWDLRFSTITPTTPLPSGGSRFVYERRMPLHTIRGTGTSLGERERPDGTRTSALRFTTADRLSPLGDGRGYWRYIPTEHGVRFVTGYTYEPGWGAFIDRLFMRRLIGWMTAFSFERLRIWAETGVVPERWPAASVLWFWKPGRPRASRALRVAPNRRVMDDAPATLDRLEAP